MNKPDTPPFTKGDRVKTDFHGKTQTMTVDKCLICNSCCQTGWKVIAVDDNGQRLDADSAWFTKVNC